MPTSLPVTGANSAGLTSSPQLGGPTASECEPQRSECAGSFLRSLLIPGTRTSIPIGRSKVHWPDGGPRRERYPFRQALTGTAPFLLYSARAEVVAPWARRSQDLAPLASVYSLSLSSFRSVLLKQPAPYISATTGDRYRAVILAEARRAKMGRMAITRVSPCAAPAREQDPASPHLALLVVDVLEAKAESRRSRKVLSVC